MSLELLGPLRSAQNARYTQGLFYEMPGGAGQPSFTVKEKHLVKEEGTYYSLRQLYMECLDPTEQKFIDLVFNGDKYHWERIKNNDVIRTAIRYDEWEEELNIRLRSLGIHTVIQEVKTDGRNKFAAAKWLAEGQWKPQKRGRPSNEEKEARLKEEANLMQSIKEDLERLNG